MEINSSRFLFWRKYGKLLDEIDSLLRNEDLLISKKGAYSVESKGLTFEEISALLKLKGIEFNEDELRNVLYFLMSNDKWIVRDDFLGESEKYKFLDKNLWNSSFQKKYYSLISEKKRTIGMLYISDTHIGSGIYVPKLINNLYDYAIKKGATVCNHLGDLFDKLPLIHCKVDLYGVSGDIITKSKEEFDRRINLFKVTYPKPLESELRTYCNMGNHDETLNLYLQYSNFEFECDLRKLSIYNPSFYMFPRDVICLKLNDIDFHFSHRLHMSALAPDLKIEELEDIKRKMDDWGECLLESYYDVMISGHMHVPFIYTNPNYWKNKDNLYLGVPSTSELNKGGVVAYLVFIYPESNCMEISLLGCDGDYNIFEKDRITWNLKGENKTYRRVLK